MKCPVCAHENKPDALYCVYCGAELRARYRALHAGQMVDGGTYRITRALGKGGMGAVYLAANTKAFDRQCVIKEVIEYYDVTDPQEREKAMRRFEEEARTLASLKHPGIPDIYAYFTENGRNYLVMEYIQGDDLSSGLTKEEDGQTVAGGPLAADKAIEYAIQMCRVLNYLETHQPPVTHNDIKPANIILDESSGQAVLVDFGTARTRYAHQAAPTPGAPGQQRSSLYGTVGYAAPELYEGRAEPRSDVYALAVTLYHLLTDDDPRNHPFKFPQMDAVPAPLRDPLREALEPDVTQRPTAAAFEQRLTEAQQALFPQAGSGALPRPLTFPNGTQALTREQLVSASLKHWDYASEILYGGSIAHWLRDALHDPVAARAADEAVARYPSDQSAGLEYLVRALEPKALAPPQMQLLTSALAYDAPAGVDRSQSIEIANSGTGPLHGSAIPSAPWIRVEERVRCPPGGEQTLAVAIDSAGLLAGKVHRGEVEIRTTDGKRAAVPVEVRIPAPAIAVKPARVDLGTADRRELYTQRGTFEVTNSGKGRADCQISGNPPWLILDPQRFSCPPGETQVVEMVGRADRLPAHGTTHTAPLRIEIEGSATRQVEVVVHTGGAPNRGSRAGTVVAIGAASLVLAGAVTWFVIEVLLPLLGL